VRSSSKIPAIVLIVIGSYFLLEKQRLIPNIGPLFRDWWPVILIVVGVILLVRRSGRGG
jgi:hypothetical protein